LIRRQLANRKRQWNASCESAPCKVFFFVEKGMNMNGPAPTSPLFRLRPMPGSHALAVACVLEQSLRSGRQPLLRGLDEAAFQRLVTHYFGDLPVHNGAPDDSAKTAGIDEFDDLLALLLAHCTTPGEEGRWLCHAVATAAMSDNHLWQDMGLPDRRALSALLAENFPALAARNTGNMRWKKFFYRQLCAAEGLIVCKSPHCAVCVDFAECFGPEDASRP
jgi:nitrogen fixation protein NifQ